MIKNEIFECLRNSANLIQEGKFQVFINESTLRLNIYDELQYLKTERKFMIGEEFNITKDVNDVNINLKFGKKRIDMVLLKGDLKFAIEFKDNFHRTFRNNESFGRPDINEIKKDLVFMNKCKKAGFTATYIFGVVPDNNSDLFIKFCKNYSIEYLPFNNDDNNGYVYYKMIME